MKNKHLTYICCLLAVVLGLLSACRKDLGNYQYHDINEGQISNINDSYSAFRGTALAISPTLKFTMDDGADTTKYTYAWYIIDQSVLPITKKTVAKSKNLNWSVNIASSTTAYTLLYEVTEVSTGAIFRKSSSLTVGTEIADGWLILNDIGGKGRLDFLNYLSASSTFKPYTDILTTFSTLTLTGAPKMVYYYYRRDPFSALTYKAIAVGTDQSTSVINTQDGTFTKFANISTMMSSYSPPPYYAQSIAAQASSNLAYLFDSNGALYYENATQRYAWGTRVNKTSAGVEFKISPYYAEAYKNSTTYALMFDTDNKRFMEHKSTNNSSSVPVPVSGNKVFSDNGIDAGNLKMDLLYMASTPAAGGRTYALFKNSASEVFLTIIQCDYSSFNPQTFEKITTAPDMINATQFAIDPTSGYIMYLVGSKIYRYNRADQTNAMVLDMGTKKVSLMKYQKLTYQTGTARYIEYASKLIVCTYDDASPNTSGQMNLYTVPGLNAALSLYQSYTGYGKIVSVSYRE
ncbi:hypothetical protein HQ865_24650 [Mucilaginibacter mali]|uniref:PKD family protein n=1 Tax=Mucilaginibacter mali TaxID=2740462 RepID=A0A7D4QXJ7_9SPHI|nr:PKD-like family lipoprotein [Mucilaginibacter mali]QKJ32809.1 hypothetical protein HQ865_24650 [Mucilaginibacter mali]